MILTLLEVLGMITLVVAVTTVLGTPLTSFLPATVPPRARWGLTPAIGLSAAICLMTSLNWIMPGRYAA